MRARSRLTNADLSPKAASTSREEHIGIGYVSVANKRSYHEDRVDACHFEGYEKFSSAQWKNAFSNTVQSIQADIKLNKYNGGSTLCCVTANGKKGLQVCNIGDSSAYFIMVNKSGQSLQLVMEHNIISEDAVALSRQHAVSLNSLHKPEIAVNQQTQFSAEEQAKYPESYQIFQAGGNVTQKDARSVLRTNSILNMSRSIGDLETARKFKDKHLSQFHTPSIMDYCIDWPEDWQDRGLAAFVVVVSDGVNDACGFNKEKLALIIETWSAKVSPTELAQKIIDYAVQQGTSDNITACVMQISPALKQLKSVMVADGHGSNWVPDFVKYHFYNRLQENLHRIAAKEIYAPADAFISALHSLIGHDTKYLLDSPVRAEMKALHANSQFWHVREYSRKTWCKLYESLSKQPVPDMNKLFILTIMLDRYRPFYEALKYGEWGCHEQTTAIQTMQRLASNSFDPFSELIILMQRSKLELATEQLQHAQEELLRTQHELEKERTQHKESLIAIERTLSVIDKDTKTPAATDQQAYLKEARLRLNHFQQNTDILSKSSEKSPYEQTRLQQLH